MIDFMSTWVEQIAIAVIIAGIFEMIIPSGHIKKYIKVVLGVYIMFSIISPFVNSNTLYDFDFNEYTNELKSSSTSANSSMDNRLQNLYIDELKKDISKNVESQGYYVHKCIIDANLFSEEVGINEIYVQVSKNKSNIENVNKVQIEIAKNEEDKQDNEIKELQEFLSSYYQIDKKKVKVERGGE